MVFANEVAKGGSRLAIQIFDECISRSVPDSFIDTLIENYESGMQYSIYFGGQNTFLDEIYKGCMLMLRAVYVSKENIIRLYVTNLNDNMHLNQVMGKESEIVIGAKSVLRSAENSLPEILIQMKYLKIVYLFFTAFIIVTWRHFFVIHLMVTG